MIGTLNKNRFIHPGYFFWPKSLLGDFNTTNQQGILAAQQAIAYWQNEYNNDPSQNALNQINYWKTQLNTLLKAQQMGPNYIAAHPGILNKWFQQFFAAFQNQIQTPGGILPFDPNDLIPDTSFFAGIPWWIWVGLAAGGVYMIWGGKKKR